MAGLGGGNLKKILKEHGIFQQLSAEGGRTSRGSMGLMIKYVEFLNGWQREEPVDFGLIEAFWAQQVRDYFNNPENGSGKTPAPSTWALCSST